MKSAVQSESLDTVRITPSHVKLRRRMIFPQFLDCARVLFSSQVPYDGPSRCNVAIGPKNSTRLAAVMSQSPDFEKNEPVSYKSPSGSVAPTSEEKRILRKIDLNILPILTLLYLLSFLDRSNIANAKLEGLTTDLHISNNAYLWTLTIYFFGYVLFEIPSNIVLKRFTPRIWLPTLMILWGIVGVSMGLVHDFGGLLVARFFLGVTEAGLFPGVVYYMSMWYARHEQHYRVSLFFSAASLSGAFGGVLAFAIGKMDGIGGKAGWSWV